MPFPWPFRTNKRSKKPLRDRSSRVRPHRLQIDPLEERQLLAVSLSPGSVSVVELDLDTSGQPVLTPVVFSVDLDAPEASVVTVDFQSVDGVGPAGASAAARDYFAVGGRVTFNPGETQQSITVGVFGDVFAELNENFSVRLSNFTGTGGIIAGNSTVTIQDDDLPFIQINNVQLEEEGPGNTPQNMIFSVTLSGPDPNVVMVNFDTRPVGGTATEGTDYTRVFGVLTFQPADTIEFVTVPIVGDTTDEINETFFVNLSNPINATPQIMQGRGTIVDNEGISVSIANTSAVEGDTGLFRDAVFTVTLNTIRPSTVTVNYTTDNLANPQPQLIPPRVGTAPFQRPDMVAQPQVAYAQLDYIPISGQLTFAPGVTTQQITVKVRGENIHELNETFLVQLSNVSTNGSETITILTQQATGTIVNDDQVPQLIVHDASTASGQHPTTGQIILFEDENPLDSIQFPEFTRDQFAPPNEPWMRPVRIQVSLSNPSSGSIAVSYSTIGETATPGIDYRRSFPNFDPSIIAGVGPIFYFVGNPVDPFFGDPLNENGARVGDVDPPFDITEYGPGFPPPPIQTGGPSVTGLPDYTQVIFMPGDQSEDIVLRINKEEAPGHGNPNVAEGDETFLVRADQFSFNSAPATIADDTGRVTIIDNHADPTFGITNPTIVEGDSGQKFMVFTVTVGSSELPREVTFQTRQFTPVNPLFGSADPGVDYLTQTGTLFFAPRQPSATIPFTLPAVTSLTVSVPILGDFFDELDEQFRVRLTNPVNAQPFPIDPVTNERFIEATGTIIDNEGPSVTLGSDLIEVEGDRGVQALVVPSVLPVVASTTVFTGQPSLSAVNDFYNGLPVTFLSGALRGQAAIVTDYDGPSRTFTVGLPFSAIPAANDAFHLGPVMRFTLSLTSASSQDIRIGFFTANASANGGSDYLPTSGTLTFVAGSPAPVTIFVPILGDTLPEGSETFQLNLTNPDPNRVTIIDSQALGTIADDDFRPSIAIENISGNEEHVATTNFVFRVRLVNSDGSPLSLPTNIKQTVSVDFATQTNSAQGNVDFINTSGNLVFDPMLPFGPGETEKLITVPVIGDTTVEPDEQFLVLLTNVFNGTILNAIAAGLIVDDDNVPNISIATRTPFEFEGNGLLFDVTLSRPGPTPITVRFDTADGTALAGSDYTAVSGTLTFAPGTTIATITVPTAVDGLVEPNETFTVTLSSATNSTVVAPGSATGTIVDADQTQIIIDNAAPVLEGLNAIFPVRLSRPDALIVTAAFATANNTAVEPGDYTATSGIITFNPGETTAFVTVPTVTDTLDELNETFLLNLSGATNANLANTQGTATITDDDGPAVSIDDVVVFEQDSGNSFMEFTVRLSNGSPQTVTVAFTTQDNTAIDENPPPPPANDYFSTAGVLTFAPGEITKKIRVSVLGDTNDELDETFFVQLSNAQSNAFPLTISDSTGTATIIDDDGPQIISQPITVQEMNAGLVFANFVVTLSSPSPQAVQVQYFTSGGTAVANQDYFPASGTITFPPNTTGPITVAVQIAPDTMPEADETFFLNLVNPTGGATVFATPIQATILDDDTLLNIADIAPVVEGNSGFQNVVLTVTMNQVLTTQVTVQFTTPPPTLPIPPGIATPGQDYTPTSGTLTFLPMVTTQQITVRVLGDLIDEPTETFDVVLSNPVGAFVGDGIATITILDNNDPRPIMSVADLTVLEGNTGITNAFFSVLLSGLSGRTITAVFNTADVSAIAGSDYIGNSGTLTFLPGDTSQRIPVGIIGDTVVENNETFQLNLSSIVFATPASLTAIGTIVDDDASLSIGNISLFEGNTGTTNAVFSVTLTKPISDAVTMNFATANGTLPPPATEAAIEPSDYAATSGALTFMPNGPTSLTITVQVNGDLVDEEDEAFSVNLTNIMNVASVTSSVGTALIQNDDLPPDVMIGDTTVVEGDAGTINAVFTVSLSQASGKIITVLYETQDNTALAGSDYAFTSNTLTFFPGEASKPIQVAVNGDLELEPNETFFVNLIGVNNANPVDTVGEATIVDDEPRMNITDASVAEGDFGTTFMVFTVTLTKANAGPDNITVDYNTVPGSGTATVGVDYQTVNNRLTFFPGDNARTISVPVIGDALDEADETFTLFLSNPVGARLINDQVNLQATGTISDDDALPVLSINDVSQTEGDAGTSNFIFTVELNAPSGRLVTVNFATANGTGVGIFPATGGTDYQARTGVLTFQPGETSRTISVPVIGDSNAEQDETFFVILSNPGNAAGPIVDFRGVGLIVNDEPSLTIGDATVMEQNTGPVGMVFPVTLSRPSAIPVTVVLNTANVTPNASAVFPADYTAVNNATLTFAVGQTSQNFTVQVQGDLIDEDNETFLVNLTGQSAGASISDMQGIGTIQDNDDPPTLSIGTATTLEGNSLVTTTAAIFTVMLSSASGKTVTVVYTTADDTALAGTDYNPTTGALTFAPGMVAQNVTVQVRGDTTGEPDEMYFVNLSGPVNATLAVAQGVGVIQDDEPRVLISDATAGESTGSIVFDISLNNTAPGPVIVSFNTADGVPPSGAEEGADYISNSGVITFQPGSGPQTITVTLLSDAIDEVDEQFTVNLSGVSGNASIFDGTGIGTITDDDLPPMISINSIVVDEGNSGPTTQAVFTLFLSAPSGQPVSVTYNTRDVTASSLSDYVAVPPTAITFAPGETVQTVTVLVNGDVVAEPQNETFEVVLSNALGATLGVNVGVASITDDEPRIFINDVTVAEGNAGTQNAVFEVTLTRPTTNPVTVNFTTQDGTATGGTPPNSDYTATNGTLSFGVGQTTARITVQVTGDVILEGNETFLVVLSVPSANALITDPLGQGLITNDDSSPGISVAASSAMEPDVGTTNMVFVVTRSPASGLPATVAFATAVGGPNPAQAPDFTNTTGTLSFAPNETTKLVTVRVVGDLSDELNETFLLNLTNPTNAIVTGSPAIGTILDNDARISIGAASRSEGNAGLTDMVFPVTLSKAVNKSVTATFNTTNGTALAGSDYNAASGNVSFAPNEISKNITVQIMGDNADESDEFFTVTLTNLSGAQAGTTQAAGTIFDDDGLPSISISDVTVLEGNSGTSSAVFIVSLSISSGQTVSVVFNTVDGSALAGPDYFATGGVLNFAPGQTSQQIVVPIVGDTTVETRETFTVVLSNPTNATITTDGTGFGTIDDNELTNLIMTGAGAGGGPHVRAFQSTTFAEQFGFFAYPGFGGGVRVASGDVNGDGQPDMITVPGAGGGPHVRVFDGRTGAVISEFFAFDGHFGGLFVAAGDTNFDGRAEVIVSADGPGANGRVRLFDGTNGALVRDLVVPFAAFNGGVRIAAGDINGDGRSDLIAGASRGNTPRVVALDAASGAVLADFFAYNPGFTGGVFVAAGDISGDGRADIITGADQGGGPHVRIFDGVTRQEIRGFFAYNAAFTGGVRVATTDFNNDGLVDIITGAGPGGGPHVRIFRGDNLQELAGIMAYGAFGGGVYVGGSLKTPGSPLHSLGSGTDSAAALTSAQLDPLVLQAVSNWIAQHPAAASRLRGIDVHIADLPSGTLGIAYADAVYVDLNADGHGWFVDATPDADEEFERSGHGLSARAGSAAADQIDLLTVIQHELGHILGLDDLSLDDHGDDLMAEALSLGTRRAPGTAVDAVFGSW